eukprot:CAMPEP_0197455024 /NCGR_PEP_ID=MMETSP1175-20131217/39659_1 /TAXON_ID=1003142 /ORGANISM="Triceratium dubium, Strain CCMP147" /LENGTH=43 /DNA_ID= /DNA_START= /DNA_END= /DNA_ORIENTATION=
MGREEGLWVSSADGGSWRFAACLGVAPETTCNYNHGKNSVWAR